MLIEKILDGLTAIIEFIAKVLVFLLKALGLWIPVLYSLLFVIVMAIFEIPFESVKALFFVGLVVAVLFAFYLMCMRVIDRKNRRYLDKKKKRANALLKKQEKLREKEERARIRKERTRQKRREEEQNELPHEYPLQTQEQNAPTQTQSVRIEEKTSANANYPYSNGNSFSNAVTPNVNSGYENMNGYRATQTVYNPPPQRADDIITKPKIFRTRMDPDMLIFEYPDRLVFYRKTQSGLEHIKTERKQST